MNKTGPHKQRLDLLLVERGCFASREQARRAIMAGEVRADGQVEDKAGTRIARDALIDVAAPPKYVSRGGHKLEAALERFAVDPAGRTCLDIGASTGGFTDCLLQRGARKVYAFDVGHGQIDWRLRNDPRVVVREGVNARFLRPSDLPEPADFCTIDVSFISLTLILPAAIDVLSPEAVVLALIKPQFELERRLVGKGGIVRDSSLHERAANKIQGFAEGTQEITWVGVTPSPIAGVEGNKEFLACMRKT